MTFRSLGAALLLAVTMAALPAAADTSSPAGKWRMYHPQTGAPHMIIEIGDENGKLEGRIVELADGPQDAICWNCVDDRKNKPLVGMTILWDFVQAGSGWNGTLLRPATGMISPAHIGLEKDGKVLKVTAARGPLRVAQAWERIE